jgi:hypothetical protein
MNIKVGKVFVYTERHTMLPEKTNITTMIALINGLLKQKS